MPTTSITSAAIDGRAQTPRFIQHQLRNLHNALRTNAQSLQDTLIADNGITQDEAALEFSLAIATVRQRLVEIDARRLLDDEYRVATGRDWSLRRSPVGVVYIRPQSHNVLYSIVAALSSAVAAGNCVVIEITTSLLQSPRLLQQILQHRLDGDTIAFVDSIPHDALLKTAILFVDQSGNPEDSVNTLSTLRTPNHDSRVVAIVDRTADIPNAATHIIRTRLAFGGHSPHAPDLVLVNEFVIDEFIEVAVKVLTQHLAGSHQVSTSKADHATRRRKQRDDFGPVLSAADRSDAETVVVLEGDNGSLVKICNRQLLALSKKIHGPVLIVSPISSLDDAIDFANSSTDVPFLASYHFAALPVAKYTSQFIRSNVSFINHIPIELSVGPAAPSQYAASATDRYRPEMFSTPAPQYVKPSELSWKLHSSGTSKTAQQSDREIFQQLALEPLPPDDQREGKVVGFFDQGLITGGLVFVGVPMVTVLGVASYYGLRYGSRWLRGR